MNYLRCLLNLVVLLCLAGTVSAQAQPKESRVALVIGNGTYKTSPLKNPVNDAKDMATKLRGLGFVVIERSNLGIRQIGSTLREFRSKLAPGGVALVFYAGHGLQIKGENYLPAVDADIGSEEDVPNQSLAIRQVMDVLSDAKTRLNLVFLDACRNNPYSRSFRSTGEGLSRVTAPSGTLISFATRPGSVAADGDGRNGLYTGALLQQMSNTGQPIEQVLKRVVTSVKAGSQNRQEPWMEGSIEGEFCFGECSVAGSASPAVSDDRALWESVKDSRNLHELRVYLKRFPLGLFADLASARINALEPLSSTPVSPSAQPQQPLRPIPVQPGATFKDCDNCPEMVVIPSGNFLMGTKADPYSSSQPSDDEQPQHAVAVLSFSLGKYEVTQEQWYTVMGSLPGKFRGRTLPVEQVAWNDAQEFVRRLSEKTGRGYRLPSEAEWEYAARAGGQSADPFANADTELGRYAWYVANSNNQPHSVGEKLPNAFGLYDMHGNVWEWTQDCWNRNYGGAPSDGSTWGGGDCAKRVFRGGSWGDTAPNLRAAFRSKDAPTNRYYNIGLRVVRDL